METHVGLVASPSKVPVWSSPSMTGTVEDEGTRNLCANLLIDLPKQALIIPSFNCYSELNET